MIQRAACEKLYQTTDNCTDSCLSHHNLRSALSPPQVSQKPNNSNFKQTLSQISKMMQISRSAVDARVAGARSPIGFAPLRPRSLVVRRFRVN
jgi:hypothetical protein